MVTPIWLTAFIDVPADEHARALAFWCAVTGHRLAPHEGDSEEYATLYPADADPHLRVQRLGDGPARVHVDLHHPDQSFRVLSSPAGLPYCEVYAVRQRRARPIKWPQGHHSAVDQLCIDIAPSRFEEECEFWSERTGWPVKGFTEHPEFRALVRPPEQPIRILLQRLEDERPTSAHLDLSSDDREAETRRHEALGAHVVRRHEWWTVLRDPVGLEYCITDRDPHTGMVGRPGAD